MANKAFILSSIASFALGIKSQLQLSASKPNQKEWLEDWSECATNDECISNKCFYFDLPWDSDPDPEEKIKYCMPQYFESARFYPIKDNPLNLQIEY